MFGDLSVNDKNWQMTKLSEICDVRDGTHASPKYCKTGYPLMTSKNFSQGFADFSCARLISQDDFEEIDRRSRVDTGDIVMPMIGTIGHPVIIRSNRKFAIKNVALFKMESSQINAACLKALLESDYFSRAVKSGNRGATQKFISLGSIRALPVPIIPEHIQGAFAELVAQVDKLRFDSLAAHMIMGQICAAANDATFACAPGSCCMCTKMRLHSAKPHFGAQRSRARCTDNAGRWGTD